MKVGITGINGFLGSRTADYFRHNGLNVVGWSRSEFDVELESPENEVVDVIIHTAARSFVPDSWNKPQSFIHTNVQGTSNVLEYARKTGAHLIFMSSYVYGEPEKLPITEEHPVKPKNPYMLSKILGEQMVSFYRDNYQIPTTIVRPFNIYGPGQKDHFLIPLIIKQAVGEGEIILNNFKPKRDYIYIDDVVEALHTITLRKTTGIFNICSGESYSAGELVEKVRSILDQNIPATDRNLVRTGEIMNVIGSYDALNQRTGWAPGTDIDTGLKHILDANK